MLNKVMVIGYLGADPEMRYTANGDAVTTFSVASSRKWTGSDGALHDETEWFRVVTWRHLAESCAQYLARGRLVYVEGRLQTRSWKDKQGIKRYSTEVIASDVRFLGGRGAAQETVGEIADDDDIEPSDLPF